MQQAAREDAFSDFTRLGLIGPQLSSVIGGFPAATQIQTSTPPSAMQQALGLGIGGVGLAGAVKGLFIMSKILRRPMFRGGGSVDSRGTGITSGLDTPKRGIVDGPGGIQKEMLI